MIKKPCFAFGKARECAGGCPDTILFMIHDWHLCKNGKLNPFYSNCQKMTEQAAAGPCLWTWNTDGFWVTSCKKAICSEKASVPSECGWDIAFKFCPFCVSKINLPGGEK